MGRFTLPQLIALMLLPLFATAQDRTFTFDATDVDATASLEGKITEYEIIRLGADELYTAWKAASGHLSFQLAGTAGSVDLQLTPWELRLPDYQVSLNGEARTDRPNRLRTPVYRGNVLGGGEAIVTFDEQFILAHYEIGGRRMTLEPLWRLQEGADRNLYILYDETKAVNAGQDACATDVSGVIPVKPGQTTGQKSMGGCLSVGIALVADTELYADFNSVASVENFMLGVLADVRTVYDDEFADEIQYQVISTTIYTNTNVDPYTNSTNASVLIDNFRIYSSNNPSSIPGDYDVASLWTGRNFDGGTIGIAYVPGICGSGRYNVCENFSSSSVQLRNVWAHELGHNFNSPHDPSGSGDPVHIMFPSVSSVSTWSAASVSTIEAYYNSVTCLEVCAPPVAVGEKVYTNIAAGTANYFFDQTEAEVETRTWSFPGGSPATSTALAPEVTYMEPGNYLATLTVTNQSGSTTTQIPVNVVETEGTEVIFREDFEDENLKVTFINPDSDPLAWELINTDGNRGIRAARADNGTLDGRGTSDFIQSPALNIDNVVSPELTIQYAYVRYDGQFRDQLRVSIIQGGAKTQVFFGDENGSGNFATGPDYIGQFGLFLPQDEEDWCFTSPGCVQIDLSGFQGGGDIIVEVENDAGYGQPLFIDNIAVVGTQAQALPVEWLSFQAADLGKSIGLNWAVNQDEDHAGFAVERATGGATAWQTIGYVPTAGNAAENVRYQFTDEEVSRGLTYQYRLRQQDVDGRESLSDIRSVSLSGYGDDGLSAYPNPTTDRLLVRLPTQTTSPFTLIDLTGRVLLSGALPAGGGELKLTELAAGVYTLVTETGSLRVVRR